MITEKNCTVTVFIRTTDSAITFPYRLVRYGQPYIDAGVDAYEKGFAHRMTF